MLTKIAKVIILTAGVGFIIKYFIDKQSVSQQCITEQSDPKKQSVKEKIEIENKYFGAYSEDDEKNQNFYITENTFPYDLQNDNEDPHYFCCIRSNLGEIDNIPQKLNNIFYSCIIKDVFYVPDPNNTKILLKNAQSQKIIKISSNVDAEIQTNYNTVKIIIDNLNEIVQIKNKSKKIIFQDFFKNVLLNLNGDYSFFILEEYDYNNFQVLSFSITNNVLIYNFTKFSQQLNFGK